VASCVLATLGELATVGGEDMKPHIPQVLPLIIETLQDQGSVVKREVALRTLGQLAQSTGKLATHASGVVWCMTHPLLISQAM